MEKQASDEYSSRLSNYDKLVLGDPNVLEIAIMGMNNVQLIDGQLLNREGSWVDWLPNSNDRQYTYYVLVTKPEYASYKLEDSTETISISYE
jgi:hypothetical protein